VNLYRENDKPLCKSSFDCANVLGLIDIHRQGRKSSSDRDMREQLRPLSLHLSLLSWPEPTQGEDLGFDDTEGMSQPRFATFIRPIFGPETGRVSRNYERCREPEVGFPFRVLNGEFSCNGYIDRPRV
jgi:hypothetical protein